MAAVASVGAVTHAVETVFHGAPSGLDTVILAERAVRFHKGRLVRFASEGERLAGALASRGQGIVAVSH